MIISINIGDFRWENIKITSLTFALKGRSGPRSSIAIATAGPSGLSFPEL